MDRKGKVFHASPSLHMYDALKKLDQLLAEILSFE